MPLLPRVRPAAFSAIPLLLAVASVAHAQPSPEAAPLRLPVPEAQRPLTLPRSILAPEVGFDVDRQGDQGTFGDLDVSVHFGVTDDLTLRALVAPLQLWAPLAGGFGYGQTTQNRGPSVGVTYRFVRSRVEIAGELTGRVFTVPGLSGGAILPALPIRIHATESFRLDVVPTVNFWIATQTVPTQATGIGAAPVPVPSPSTSANAVRVQVPVTALGNLTEAFAVGLTTGLTIYDVSDARQTTGIPLGGRLGYAIRGAHGPVADIDPYFSFPYLLMPWRSSVTNTGQYVGGVNVTGYLYL